MDATTALYPDAAITTIVVVEPVFLSITILLSESLVFAATSNLVEEYTTAGPSVSSLTTPYIATVTAFPPPSYASQQSEPRFTTTVVQSPMPLATSPPLSTLSLHGQSSSCVTSMLAAGTTTSVDYDPEFTATFVSPITSPVLVCAIPKTLFAETSAGSTAALMPSNSQAFGSSGTHQTPNALTVVLGTLSAVLFVVILALGVLIRRKSALEKPPTAPYIDSYGDLESNGGAKHCSEKQLSSIAVDSSEHFANTPSMSRFREIFTAKNEAAILSGDQVAVASPHLPSSHPASLRDPPSYVTQSPSPSPSTTSRARSAHRPPLPSAFWLEKDGETHSGYDVAQYTQGSRQFTMQSNDPLYRMSDSNASTLPPPYED